MLFPDYTDPDIALTDLAAAIAATPTVPINPLPCDRWIARSCLQKAVRRAEPELAQRALANLFEHDRRAMWRHLTIIALEDVGVANIRALEWIIAAQQNRAWRNDQGGDWPVMAELVRQLAVSDHCQGACDLLLRALNDPALEADRAAAIEMDAPALAEIVSAMPGAIEMNAIAAMALGGGLAEGQRLNDPFAVFDILLDNARSPRLAMACREAWKLCRSPMAFLLPIVWECWIKTSGHQIADDQLPPVHLLSGLPGYALDQFTRVGNAVSRSWLRHDEVLRRALGEAGIQPGSQARAVGDLLFLVEGGLLARRVVWRCGDALRLPVRQLPTVHLLGQHISSLARYVVDNRSVLAKLRIEHFLPVDQVTRLSGR